MSSPERFVLDEHLGRAVWTAIDGHNQRPGAPPITVYRIGEPPAPPLGTGDPEILAWAAENQCIVLSCDRDTLIGHLADHLAAGHSSPGVLILPSVFSIPALVDFLLAVAYASESWEWADRVTYF